MFTSGSPHFSGETFSNPKSYLVEFRERKKEVIIP